MGWWARPRHGSACWPTGAATTRERWSTSAGPMSCWPTGALTACWRTASATAARALETARAIGYASGESYACSTFACAASYAGDTRSALAWAQAAQQVDKHRVSGHTARFAATTLACTLADDGDLAGAEAIFNENLELCRKAGDRSFEAMQLEALARILVKTG